MLWNDNKTAPYLLKRFSKIITPWLPLRTVTSLYLFHTQVTVTICTGIDLETPYLPSSIWCQRKEETVKSQASFGRNLQVRLVVTEKFHSTLLYILQVIPYQYSHWRMWLHYISCGHAFPYRFCSYWKDTCMQPEKGEIDNLQHCYHLIRYFANQNNW